MIRRVKTTQSRKSEIIKYCNKTKLNGLDTTDKVLDEYTVKQQINIALGFYYKMIVVTCFASFIVNKENNPEIRNKNQQKNCFIKISEYTEN